jgi:hypothetical protein
MPPRQDTNVQQQRIEIPEVNALLLPSGTIALAGLQCFIIMLQLLNSARRAAEDPILHSSRAITTTRATIPAQVLLSVTFGMVGLALYYLSGGNAALRRGHGNPPPITFAPNQAMQARLQSFNTALRKENSKDVVGAIACIAGLICELFLIHTQLVTKHNIVLGIAFFLIIGRQLLQLNNLFAREDQNKITAVERLIRHSQPPVVNENPLSQNNSNRNSHRN